MSAAALNLPSLRYSGFPTLRACALAFLALALCALAAAPRADDAETPALESSVKAAFLYKFAGYVEWPDAAFPQPDTPITIGVAGDDRFAQVLSQLVADHAVNGRPLAVRKLKEGDSLAGVHILFIARAQGARQADWIRLAQSQPVLVVTESDGALVRGSMINFVLAEEHLRFEVAPDNAEKRGLKVSSRLLGVARNIRNGAS